MAPLLLLLLLILLLPHSSLLIRATSVIKGKHAPRFAVNLDDDPLHMWDVAIGQYNQTIHASLQGLFDKHPSVKAGMDVVKVAIEARPSVMRTWFGERQYAELSGISRETNIEIELLAALNVMYDVSASKIADGKAMGCTGIVVEASDQSIVHGRNLDYGFPQQMENLTAVVDFQRGGETVYSSVSLIFMVGFNTAMKPHAFSLSHDERDQGSIFDNWFHLFVEPRQSTFSRIRDIVDTASTFDDAAHMLSTVPLIANSYFILGGTQTQEGAIITRTQNECVDQWTLGHPSGGDVTNSTWYVLETNYDSWERPASNDNRRAAAVRFLDASGPGSFVNSSFMMKCMTNTEHNVTNGERPVYNSDTVYTAVMQAAQPENFVCVVHGAYPD